MDNLNENRTPKKQGIASYLAPYIVTIFAPAALASIFIINEDERCSGFLCLSFSFVIPFLLGGATLSLISFLLTLRLFYKETGYALGVFRSILFAIFLPAVFSIGLFAGYYYIFVYPSEKAASVEREAKQDFVQSYRESIYITNFKETPLRNADGKIYALEHDFDISLSNGELKTVRIGESIFENHRVSNARYDLNFEDVPYIRVTLTPEPQHIKFISNVTNIRLHGHTEEEVKNDTITTCTDISIDLEPAGSDLDKWLTIYGCPQLSAPTIPSFPSFGPYTFDDFAMPQGQ